MTDKDGLRVEAAEQCGFAVIDDTPTEYAEWKYGCTEAQLIAFARSCERKSLAEAVKVATGELRNTSLLLSNPPKSAAAWDIRNALSRMIETIDAEIAPVTDQSDAAGADFIERRAEKMAPHPDDAAVAEHYGIVL